MKRFFDFLLPERTHLKAVIAALIAIFLLSGVLAYQVHRSEIGRIRMEAEQTHSYSQVALHKVTESFETWMFGALRGTFSGSVRAGLRGGTHDDIRHAVMFDQLCGKCAAIRGIDSLYQLDLRTTSDNNQELPANVVAAVRHAATHPFIDSVFTVGAFIIPTGNSFDSYAFMRDVRKGSEAAWVFRVPKEYIAYADSTIIADTEVVPVELMKGHRVAELFHIEAHADGSRIATTAVSPAPGGNATTVGHQIAMFPQMSWIVSVLPQGRDVLVPRQDRWLSPRWPIAVMFLIMTAILMAIALVRREEELYRLRSDLISGVSHELRTPLAQIRMFAETLLLGRTRTESERRRSLEIIDQEAKRLSHFVDNMLQFAKGEGGRTKLAPEPTSFAVEVRRAVESFIPMCQARGVEVRTELEDGVTAPVDRAALRRIMLNLMENALKYGPDEQRITVGVALFGDVVRLWVDDEGEGIPRADRERVFDSFYRLSRELDRRITGSGIGLAVVRQLATLHNGRAWAEEAPGGGARLVVEFPDAYVRPIEEGTGWAVA